MIHFSNEVFHLNTKDTSYIMDILPSKHLRHLYYGKKIEHQNAYGYMQKMYTTPVGNTTDYHPDYAYSLDVIPLELSTAGKGDYKTCGLEIFYEDGSSISDFQFSHYEILDGVEPLVGMPRGFQNNDSVSTLKITLKDDIKKMEVVMSYSVFYEKNIITRNIVLHNKSQNKAILNKVMSFNLDFQYKNFDLLTLDGKWIKERHVHRGPLREGCVVIDSRQGVSSSKHSPFLVLLNEETTEHFGDCYGFALMYSGNHYGMVEVSAHQLTRIQMGIQPFEFMWHLEPGTFFETPDAVLTFTDQGLNKMSQHYHQWINENVIRKEWQYMSRPILLNNWEATYFDFNESKLLKLAKSAADLGIELFVLDDGWFGSRNDDKTALGDWFVNTKKLPKGIKNLSNAIHKLGMDFGLWVEPEMVSIDSELYRKHPDWAVQLKDRTPSFGRNQLVLDLANPDVVSYLTETLTTLFKEGNVQYIKWDMNRNFSDFYSASLPSDRQQEFHHRYVLGLYRLLESLTKTFPEILFESCSSGGNRFDLGMLYYMPQTWTSDNTDGYERQKIQYGTSMLFPLSTMGAHVSDVPSHQVLRDTPLETRFNVAMFGVLGYELDVTQLTTFERKAIKRQIEFYKKHRRSLQFGQFTRLLSPFMNNEMSWQVEDEKILLGYYQGLQEPNGPLRKLMVKDAKEDLLYKVYSRPQYLNIKAFGDLVNHVSPIKIKGDSIIQTLVSNHYLFELNNFEEDIPGDALLYDGFRLQQQFMGTGYNDQINHLGDFGSRVFVLNPVPVTQK
ncbi:MAG: alpha-galactosidase [Clostridia bacterium]|nr:alpha-galactosidase [Clostridia bacterium]